MIYIYKCIYLYKVCSKIIDTEAVFSKTLNEMFIFLKIILRFNTLIPSNFPLVKALLTYILVQYDFILSHTYTLYIYIYIYIYTHTHKEMQLIYKGGVNWWEKIPKKILPWLKFKLHHPSYRSINMGSAEVVTQTCKFEKSATEPKQHLLRCRNTFNIATFNVRTLNSIIKSATWKLLFQ